jgi:hypothetical protein
MRGRGAQAGKISLVRLGGEEGGGMAERCIKEGKYALNWHRLSCHRFVASQMRLKLFVVAYNQGNFLGRLGLPKAIGTWLLQILQLKLIEIGDQIVRHARSIVFRLAEVAKPRDLFAARRAPGQPNNSGGGVSKGEVLPSPGLISSPGGRGDEDWGCCSLGAAGSKRSARLRRGVDSFLARGYYHG